MKRREKDNPTMVESRIVCPRRRPREREISLASLESEATAIDR